MAILPDRTALTDPADGDLYMTTDVSDTTDAAGGTDKKITWANIVAKLTTAFNALYQSIPAEGEFADGDKTKLDGIEALADVTDATNVTAAGALMDSELTSIADVKALNQSVISGATPTFTTTNFTDATNKRLMTDAQETVLDNTSGTNTGDEPAASSTVAGISELATAAELNTGTDTGRAVTPASMSAYAGGTSIATLGTVTAGTLDGVAVRDLAIDVTPDTDHTASGFIHSTLSAAAALSQFDCVYVDANSRWAKADASATATADKLLGIAMLSAAASAAATVALPNSYIRDDTWTWTVGSAVLLSETAGGLTQTAPTTTDAVVRVVGYAVNADVLYFNPETGVVHT